MSIEEEQFDTEYYASTDYNQRLEEKVEMEYEKKTGAAPSSQTVEVNGDIDALIAENKLNALYNTLASEQLAESDYLKLAAVGDKDIHIALARNEHITDAVAEKLIGTVYIAHKLLLSNPALSETLKTKLKTHLSGNPVYADLI